MHAVEIANGSNGMREGLGAVKERANNLHG
jgi:hypothetical protein